MKKLILLVLILLGAYFLWAKTDLKESIQSPFESDTIVIEFTTSEDLLAQLRQVEAGSKIDMRWIKQETGPVSTGISCNDHAAKAEYMRKERQERQEMENAINEELKRIRQKD